jgi:hypothetical protein
LKDRDILPFVREELKGKVKLDEFEDFEAKLDEEFPEDTLYLIILFHGGVLMDAQNIARTFELPFDVWKSTSSAHNDISIGDHNDYSFGFKNNLFSKSWDEIQTPNNFTKHFLFPYLSENKIYEPSSNWTTNGIKFLDDIVAPEHIYGFNLFSKKGCIAVDKVLAFVNETEIQEALSMARNHIQKFYSSFLEKSEMFFLPADGILLTNNRGIGKKGSALKINLNFDRGFINFCKENFATECVFDLLSINQLRSREYVKRCRLSHVYQYINETYPISTLVVFDTSCDLAEHPKQTPLPLILEGNIYVRMYLSIMKISKDEFIFHYHKIKNAEGTNTVTSFYNTLQDVVLFKTDYLAQATQVFLDMISSKNETDPQKIYDAFIKWLRTMVEQQVEKIYAVNHEAMLLTKALWNLQPEKFIQMVSPKTNEKTITQTFIERNLYAYSILENQEVFEISLNDKFVEEAKAKGITLSKRDHLRENIAKIDDGGDLLKKALDRLLFIEISIEDLQVDFDNLYHRLLEKVTIVKEKKELLSNPTLFKEALSQVDNISELLQPLPISENDFETITANPDKLHETIVKLLLPNTYGKNVAREDFNFYESGWKQINITSKEIERARRMFPKTTNNFLMIRGGKTKVLKTRKRLKRKNKKNKTLYKKKKKIYFVK